MNEGRMCELEVGGGGGAGVWMWTDAGRAGRGVDGA